MSENAISEWQQYWLDHIKAADASEGTLINYAQAQGLTVKDLYQWKTVLARRGVIAAKGDRPKAFVPVRETVTASAAALVLPNGSRLELSGSLDSEHIKALILAESELG